MGGRELWKEYSAYGRDSTGFMDLEGSNTRISIEEVEKRGGVGYGKNGITS